MKHDFAPRFVDDDPPRGPVPRWALLIYVASAVIVGGVFAYGMLFRW